MVVVISPLRSKPAVSRKTFRYASAAMWSIDVLTLGFRKSIKNLCDPILKFCQFPLQSTNLQKAGCYFTEVSAHQFIAVGAPGALITVPKHVSNGLLRCAKALSDLVILQTTCDEEHRSELHRLQEICQRWRVEGVQRIGRYG
jgi:hypothetical protein